MSARLKWSLGIAVVLLAAAGIGVLLMSVITSATRPVIQCAPAQAASKPPVTLVTAADYLAQGDYEFDRGDCARAIAAYGRAIELNPNYAEAYNNRAYAYMTQQDYARALSDLDRAIALRPTYTNALMNRGDIHNYYYDIDYDLAIADYDRVLALGAQHTAVCGHRLLAVNHGWNSSTFVDIFVRGGATNCERPSPGF